MKPEKVVLNKVEIVCKADSDDCREGEGNKTMLSKEAKKAINDMGAITAVIEETIKELTSNKGLAAAVTTVARCMGNASNTLSVFKTMYSNNLSSKALKASVKIWVIMSGGGSIGAQTATKKA